MRIFPIILILLLLCLSGCNKSNVVSQEKIEGTSNIITPIPEDIKSIITATTPVPEDAGRMIASLPVSAAGENIKHESSAPENNTDNPTGKKQNPTIDVNKNLIGRTICVDPGHGNPNHPNVNEPIAPGSNILKPATAYGTTGVSTKIPEYVLNMAVSLKLRDELEKLGAKVIMTRTSSDEDLGNIERAKIANENMVDLAIRIHADGSDNSGVTGMSVLYPGGQYVNDASILDKSKNAAGLILKAMSECTESKSRGIIARDDLTGFNWTKVPVILVEMGFMTNPGEDRNLNSTEFQDKLVDGIINGLISYFG